jgi:hypothetical protein
MDGIHPDAVGNCIARTTASIRNDSHEILDEQQEKFTMNFAAENLGEDVVGQFAGRLGRLHGFDNDRNEGIESGRILKEDGIID